nr:helix-turn-helix transcriptional regulator [uncultured Dysosmobacter sp.]
MAFSENLQFIRAQAGVTQEQLAEQLEVSRQSVSKWESNASFPEMDTLLRICDLYDVDLDTLLRGSVEESRISDTARYDAFMNRFSLRMSLAIAAIIAGIGLMALLNAAGVAEYLSAAAFLLVVTLSVVVIVASGIQHENFRKQHPVIADFYPQTEKDAFHAKFVWYISGGVGAILFDVVLFLLFGSMLPEREPYESLLGGVFLLIIAGAVFSFVYGGMQEDKYKIWKYNRDNNPTPEAKKKLDLIGASCAVIMLLATAVYVGLGLTRDAWSTAWWVFAVGGILCGAVSVALNPYKGED